MENFSDMRYGFSLILSVSISAVFWSTLVAYFHFFLPFSDFTVMTSKLVISHLLHLLAILMYMSPVLLKTSL